jgi:transcriptional regulator with XRE-family HTH domain
MTGPPPELDVGARVARFRRRRGLTQQALAGLVGRTPSWVEKIESGRAALDRISVVRDLAEVLDVSFGDLIADDSADVAPPTQTRDLVLDYRALNPRFTEPDDRVAHVGAAELRRMVDDVWTAYQDSRWGYVVMRLNHALPAAYLASQRDDAHRTASRALAHLYHVAASLLVKLGKPSDAWVCAERGDLEARSVGEPVVLLSLQRGIAHALLSSGRYADAVGVVRDGLLEAPDPNNRPAIAVTGTLMLVGATASALAGERSEATGFLRHAELLADKLGRDGNDVWTSFGPTNVAIHRVAVAAELGDPHGAARHGELLDARAMPRERRVRHQLEVARAFAKVGRTDDALRLVLDAERTAPEQVRRHFVTRELLHDLLRAVRTRPNPDLVALAKRLGHAP